MHGDRYLKAVLTLIALELGWIGFNQMAVPARAQAQPTPVVITGIDLREGNDFLPVAVLGQTRGPATGRFQPLDMTVRNNAPIAVSTSGLVEVRTVSPIRIENDRSRPVWVENVGYTPARVPGE